MSSELVDKITYNNCGLSFKLYVTDDFKDLCKILDTRYTSEQLQKISLTLDVVSPPSSPLGPTGSRGCVGHNGFVGPNDFNIQQSTPVDKILGDPKLFTLNIKVSNVHKDIASSPLGCKNDSNLVELSLFRITKIIASVYGLYKREYFDEYAKALRQLGPMTDYEVAHYREQHWDDCGGEYEYEYGYDRDYNKDFVDIKEIPNPDPQENQKIYEFTNQKCVDSDYYNVNLTIFGRNTLNTYKNKVIKFLDMLLK